MPAAKRRLAVADLDVAGTSGREEDEPASNVIYIGHLPHGFFEKQLLGYFSQFGKVTRVRVSRSKKTAKAKHYAFVEFQLAEVAKIASDAMDGYFLFTQKLVCKLMPLNKIHPKLFIGANRKFRAIPWQRVERRRHDRDRTPGQHAKMVARLIAKDKKRQQKIKDAGIDYEYPALSDGVPLKPQKIVFE